MKLAYRTKQALLASGDLVSFGLGFYASLTLRNWQIPTAGQIEKHLAPFLIVFFLWLIINYINGLYDLERQTNDRAFYRRLSETAGFSLLFGMVFFYLIPDQKIAPKTILLLNVLLGYAMAALWRLIYAHLVGADTLLTNVVIVGRTPDSDQLIQILQRRPAKGYRVAAVIDPQRQAGHHLEELQTVVRNTNARLVVVTPDLQKNDEALRHLYQLLFTSVEVTDLTNFYEIITGRIPPSTFSEGWFLQHLCKKEKPIYDRARAGFDYLIALTMGAVLLLLLPLIAAAIKLNSRGPIFIKQRRVGQNGRLFTLYKFRSMYALSPDGSAELGEYNFEKWVAKKDDQRVTPVGKFLRKTRLDELPQVINLLKRDMTLIGPRPERPEIVRELESRMPYYTLRHVVRPGLTGWALIHQNYTDTFDKALEKLQYDLYYIKNRSLLLDLTIGLRTINVLVRLMGQ